MSVREADMITSASIISDKLRFMVDELLNYFGNEYNDEYSLAYNFERCKPLASIVLDYAVEIDDKLKALEEELSKS